jgi:hypothetical protein
MLKRCRFLLLTGLFSVSALCASDFDWCSIPSGEWTVVPTSGQAAPKVFHGGATIAPDREMVFFFGSDTHSPTELENGETNSVWRLNLKTLEWSKDYEQDLKSTYRILANGECETDSGRPWAMHTFDAVEYDPDARKVVVISYPLHTRFRPEERFHQFEGDWFKHLTPSHWEYDPDTRKWERLATGPPNLFAKALAWDSQRRLMVGHDGARTYHFRRGDSRWRAFDSPSSSAGYHLTMIHNTLNSTMLLLGKNGGSNILYSYDPDRTQWSVVPVESSPLPANGATIAFDTKNHVMLYLANRYENQYNNPTGKAATFIYHAGEHRWEEVEIASPELYGMNYLMQYDPVRNVFLHFEKSADSGNRVKLWAFRYR